MAMEIDEENGWKAALELEFRQTVNDLSLSDEKEHDDMRLMSAFIAKIRWDLAVKDMDTMALVRLAAAPTIRDPLYAIILSGRRYIQRCCEQLSGGNMIIRRLLMSAGYFNC